MRKDQGGLRCRECFVVCLALVCLGFISSANALTVRFNGSAVFLSGNIEPGDFAKFDEHMNRNSGVTTVVFEDCFGGQTNEAVQIGEFIKSKGLSTVAKGQVQSACAYAFLGGQRRRFSSGWGTNLILLHASRNQDPRKDVATKVNKFLLPYLVQLTGGRLRDDMVALIGKSTQAKQGVIFLSRDFLIKKVEEVRYCDGSENGVFQNCKNIPDVDALGSGVVTQN